MEKAVRGRARRPITAALGLLLLLGIAACGGKAATSPDGAVPATAAPIAVAPSRPTLPPTPPPAQPLPVPAPGGAVAHSGASDSVASINPSTYDASDPCAYLPSQTPTVSVPASCNAEWTAMNVNEIPGADLMNSMAMPHTISVAPNVDQSTAVAAATGFFRWQAFQTWAEQNAALTVMQTLDPPGHVDPIATALAQQGSHVAEIAPCNLPVALRVVKLDQTALSFIRSSGWPANSDIAVLATYTQCVGVDVIGADGKVTTIEQGSPLTAINPGELVASGPFGKVWKIEGEVACGSGDQLQAVCNGGI